jgi:hypothetical protein
VVVDTVVRSCGAEDRFGGAVDAEVLRLFSSDRLRMTIIAVSGGRPLTRVWLAGRVYGRNEKAEERAEEKTEENTEGKTEER